MEVPPLQTGERTKIDVDGSPEAIPTGKVPLLLALEALDFLAAYLIFLDARKQFEVYPYETAQTLKAVYADGACGR